MLDQEGRVIINPSMPLRMEDFQYLYATEGRTPDDAAGRIHMNYPTEAKSYMSEAWSRLGTGLSPEQYFNDPANAAALEGARGPIAGRRSAASALAAKPVAGPVGSIEGGPMQFRNELERQEAILTGKFDAMNRSPLALRVGELQTKDSAQSMMAGALDRTKNQPLYRGIPDDKLAAAQIAGDVFGDTKKVLQSLQKVNPNTVGPLTSGYRPKTGIGNSPSETGINSSLDFDIVNDPEFVRTMSRNPERASYVYKSITGREYKDDADMHNKMQKERADLWKPYVVKQLQAGAKMNPNTGKWMVWRTVENDNAMPGGDDRPIRKMMEANPEEQFGMDTYYSRVMGKDLPAKTLSDPQSIFQEDSAMKRIDPDSRALVDADVQRIESKTGFPLRPEEKLAIAAKILQARGVQGSQRAETMNYLMNQNPEASFVRNAFDLVTAPFPGMKPVRDAAWNWGRDTIQAGASSLYDNLRQGGINPETEAAWNASQGK